MDYLSTKQVAEKWGISQRRIRILCEQGKIAGAIKVGKSYNIPETAKKPIDARIKTLTLDEIYQTIETLKFDLDSRRPLSEGELKRLNEDFMIENTYNSNAIEGNTLTLKETSLVLQGITIDKKPIKEHLEATQHKDAFNYVCELVSKKEPISEKVIKEIHSFILNDIPSDRGVYRNLQVRILGAIHIPPNPLKIPELISTLLNDYKEDTSNNVVKKIAIFHLRFERIHPFIDGNGRTGRLIANLELMKMGYPPIDIKFIDREEYYDCFNEFDLNQKTERMERLFANYLLERLKEYLEIIK